MTTFRRGANYAAVLPAVLTTILFAFSAVCASRTTRILGGTQANFWRVSIAGLLLGVWAHMFGHGLSGHAFPYFLVSGCVGFGIGDLALYQAFPRLGSRLCMILVHCVAAPFAALVEWAWLGTSITGFQMACGVVILSGVAFALAPDQRLNLSRQALLGGILFGTIAGCGQGFGAVLSRKAYQVAASFGEEVTGLNGGITAAYQRIIAGWVIGAVFYLVVTRLQKRSLASEPKPRSTQAPADPPNPRRRAWPWVLGNALAGPSVGVSCFQWALTMTPTAVVLPVVAVTPLVVIPFAQITEGDRPSLRSVVGATVAVAGVVTLTWTRLRG